MDKFCSNCGTPKTGNFCSNGGKAVQPNPDPTAEYVSTSYIEPTYDNYNTKIPKIYLINQGVFEVL
jgi:hypothetical protein